MLQQNLDQFADRLQKTRNNHDPENHQEAWHFLSEQKDQRTNHVFRPAHQST